MPEHLFDGAVLKFTMTKYMSLSAAENKIIIYIVWCLSDRYDKGSSKLQRHALTGNNEIKSFQAV